MCRLAFLLTTIIALCTACGLKGPLYLPEKPAPVVITPATDSSSSSSSSASATP